MKCEFLNELNHDPNRDPSYFSFLALLSSTEWNENWQKNQTSIRIEFYVIMWTNYLESEIFAEKFAADFGNGFLEQSWWAQHVHDGNQSRKEVLKRKLQQSNHQLGEWCQKATLGLRKFLAVSSSRCSSGRCVGPRWEQTPNQHHATCHLKRTIITRQINENQDEYSDSLPLAVEAEKLVRGVCEGKKTCWIFIDVMPAIVTRSLPIVSVVN